MIKEKFKILFKKYNNNIYLQKENKKKKKSNYIPFFHLI
jgi:hypothetical protein